MISYNHIIINDGRVYVVNAVCMYTKHIQNSVTKSYYNATTSYVIKC